MASPSRRNSTPRNSAGKVRPSIDNLATKPAWVGRVGRILQAVQVDLRQAGDCLKLVAVHARARSWVQAIQADQADQAGQGGRADRLNRMVNIRARNWTRAMAGSRARTGDREPHHDIEEGLGQPLDATGTKGLVKTGSKHEIVGSVRLDEFESSPVTDREAHVENDEHQGEETTPASIQLRRRSSHGISLKSKSKSGYDFVPTTPALAPAADTAKRPPRKLFSRAPFVSGIKPGLPEIPEDSVTLKRIVWIYAQGFLGSFAVGMPCNLLVYGLSVVGWEWKQQLEKAAASAATMDLGPLRAARATMSPTAFAILCSVFFVSSLPWFVAVQFVTLHSWRAFLKSGLRFATPIVTSAIAIGMGSLYASGTPYWFYYGDVFLLVLAYVSMIFVSGYYTNRTVISRLDRIMDGLEFSIIEAMVAVAAVAYGIFIMPIYSWLPHTWKLVWRFTAHPIYWEFFVKLATRRLVIAKAGSSLSSIDAIAMAHAQSHVTVMQASLVAGMEDLNELVITLVTIHAVRLVIRLTTIYHEKYLDAFFDWLFSRTPDPEAEERRLESARYLLAIEIQTEIILENGAVYFTSTLAQLFAEYGAMFSMTLPFNKSYSTEYNFYTVLIQLAFAIVFDVIGMYVNQRWACRLPYVRTWREVCTWKWSELRESWDLSVALTESFEFAAYTILTMGLSAQIYLVARLPRGMLCTDPWDSCSCAFLNDAAKAICQPG
ncbi:hypothetical protein HK104_005119 [Borealophlyctis nickersoniae]|nr:hypothetical protein HK104_005119 [Borealophlyctis nickersoniae]